MLLLIPLSPISLSLFPLFLSFLLSLSPLPLSPLPPLPPSLQSTGRTGNQNYLSSFSKSLQVDHWPALPSTSTPGGGQPGNDKPSKTTVDWSMGGGGEKANEQGQQQEWGKGEGGEELQHLMKSLDIADHLHVLQVLTATYPTRHSNQHLPLPWAINLCLPHSMQLSLLSLSLSLLYTLIFSISHHTLSGAPAYWCMRVQVP